ncbi:hypothetical protein GGE07_006563, partial [Sinorhizobium terangae]|nr:hypothetical protein [Sinorhizobium terangae]
MAGRKIAPGGIERPDGDRYYDKVFTQRINVSKLNETINRYIRGSEIGQYGQRACPPAREADLSRSGVDQRALRQPNRLAPRQSLLGLPFAR